MLYFPVTFAIAPDDKAFSMNLFWLSQLGDEDQALHWDATTNIVELSFTGDIKLPFYDLEQPDTKAIIFVGARLLGDSIVQKDI